MRRPQILVLALLATALATGIVLFLIWPRPGGTDGTGAVQEHASDQRKIKATLFYVSDDGTRLVPVERDVAFGEGTLEQARRVIEAQVDAAPAGRTSAIPPGTRLRGVFLTERGEAYVDLTSDVVAAHPGGAATEILTVYSIVGALVVNLPAVKAVQILVDGREVDTLAGHVDLRRPLPADEKWLDLAVESPAASQPAAESKVPGTAG